MPHAQGVSDGGLVASADRPNGKGIPMQKPNGAINAMLSRILMTRGQLPADCINGPSSARYAMPSTMITATALAVTFFDRS